MMNELLSIFEPLIELHFNTLPERCHNNRGVPSLFRLVFNIIEAHNIPKRQLPPSLRDLSYVKAVTIDMDTIYYYTSFVLNVIPNTNPFVCKITGTNYIGYGPYKGTVPDGVEYVNIYSGYAPVLPKSVKYLSLSNLRDSISINIPLVYLRLIRITKRVNVICPIKVLVVDHTKRDIYYLFLKYVDYLIYQSIYSIPPRNAIVPPYRPQKLSMYSYSMVLFSGEGILISPEGTQSITLNDLILYFSKKIQKLLNDE